MAITLPTGARGPILDLELPPSEDPTNVILRNKTTDESLAIVLPAEWGGDDISLDFYRKTITDGTGADRSALLDAKVNDLWLARDPLVTGVNDVEVEVEQPSLAAIDDFEQADGALSGKTAERGGVWAGFGDAVDFAVNKSLHVAERTELSDANLEFGGGRAAILTSVSLGDVWLKKRWVHSVLSGLGPAAGFIARYKDASNYVRIVILRSSVSVYSIVKGSNASHPGEGSSPVREAGVEYEALAHIDPEGNFAVWVYPASMAPSTTPQFSGQATNLKTSVLAAGGVGFYDSYTGATPSTRTYRGFRAWDLSANAYSAKATLRWEKGYF